MEELYTESFFTSTQVVLPAVLPSSVPVQPHTSAPEKKIETTAPVAAVEAAPDKSLVEIYETTNQMNFYLDKLEKALFDDYKNFSDFEFIIKDVRTKIKDKQMDGVYDLLAELEELVDLA